MQIESNVFTVSCSLTGHHGVFVDAGFGDILVAYILAAYESNLARFTICSRFYFSTFQLCHRRTFVFYCDDVREIASGKVFWQLVFSAL